MSQNPDCPYCGSSVPIDHARVGYDEKVKIQCSNCGGQFEYMPGFGSFSLPGEGPRTQQRRVRTEGSYPGAVYEGEAPWTASSQPPKKSGCGTCCTICCCCLLFPILSTLMLFGFFGGFMWLFG
ncbi:MAG: hypothetical protein ACTSSE_10935 [Candidatus Thorarchaeota archaeon]